MDFDLPSWVIREKHAQTVVAYSKLRALLENGLTEVDLTRCWVTWRIMPLSRQPNLMCNYSGDSTDAQWNSSDNLEANEINKVVKKLLRETQECCNKTSMQPFFKINPPPPVSIHITICLAYQSLLIRISHLLALFNYVGQFPILQEEENTGKQD